MAQVPIDEAVDRFKNNEDRFDKFINDDVGYNASTGEAVESVKAFLSRFELAADIYQDTTAGLAAVASGSYFMTPSPNYDESLILYFNNSSVAEEIKRFPNIEGVVTKEFFETSKGDIISGGVFEENDLVWAIIDSNKNVAFGVTSSGATVGYINDYVDSINATLVSRFETDEANIDINSAEIEEIKETFKGVPFEGSDIVWGVCDSNNNVALAVKASGEVIGYLSNFVNEQLEVQSLTLQTFVNNETLPFSSEAANLVWAITDKNGLVALGVTTEGEVVGGFNFDKTFEIFTNDDFIYSIVDESNNVVFGITSDGKIQGYYTNLIDALMAEVQSLTISGVDSYDAQPIVYPKTVGTYQQVFALNDQGEFEVTPDEYDALNPSVHKNSYIKFGSDKDGTLKMWRKSLYGTNLIKSYNNTIEHFLVIGQSNSIPKTVSPGGGPLTLGKVLESACLQFNGDIDNSNLHPWPNYFTGWSTVEHDNEIVDSEIDYFIDLEGNVAESHAYGFSAVVNEDDRIYLWSGHGKGGAGYSVIKKGTQAYANSIKCVQRGKALAESLGMAYKVVALLNEHGESDAQNANYLSNLNEWVSDYNEDIKAITGQTEDVLMYISQQQSWSLGGVYDTSESVIAQLEFHEQNQIGFLVAPKYFLPHDNAGTGDGSANDGDGIHLSAYGVRTMAEYYAKAFKAGAAWSPLRPSSVVFDGIDKITVSFAGRVGDLRFSVYNSTTNPLGVSDPGNYGFELFDGGGAIITGVAVSTDKTQIEITVDSVLTAGAELAYAYTSETLPAEAGPLTGPRGCLCDSDIVAPSQELQDHRQNVRGFTGAAITDPLKNWCVTFKKSIQI
ncbi:MAG: hypothetical protein CMH23_07015 [Methylophaga sp.]|uniref:hypothetical protein n=1 Tax=Methylophaga sp. TaxID=2024840 RepID=UPI000C8A7A60|nr:hypothetical protein [Methylophaga sp.]MBN46209.1 hypothetical protein [Methylophaga sp.]QDP56593.1 MAG: hypothetical protein GOVbin2380_28 [Prokaryotic dsDNA virus sp.]|tara:strand:- start:7274 stop:9802 length:2529 start_codon:yes stop_codon:yes gene_type:complete